MIKKILLGIVVVIAVFIVIIALQPSEYRIERSATIVAPPAVVFAQVNDFHKWEAWSPWAKLDPSAKNTYAGPTAGTGAFFSWAGNDKVGEGRMTMLESRLNDHIQIRLDFLKPFPSTATAGFDFKPDGNQTIVTWSMTGQNNFVSKAIFLFVSMDKMLGGEFEKGLANLKIVSETK
jgi:hypothetical protein